MNRRQFISLLGSGAVVAAVGNKLSVVAPPTKSVLPKKYGEFDVAEDGTLSLDGQSRFPVYGADGGLAFEVVSYRLGEDGLVETVSQPQESWLKKGRSHS